MRIIRSEIIIQASLQTVWDTLISIEKYPEWNPFIVNIQANAKPTEPGVEMKFRVRWANGTERSTLEIVKNAIPPKGSPHKAVWEYDYGGLLPKIKMIYATRSQALCTLSDGATLYQTEEKFQGWGIGFIPYKKVQQGFDDMAKALKKRCEG